MVGLIPEQATPVFSAKLRVVSLAILEALADASGVLRFSLLRTRAMLLMAMVSLQRGKQLGGTRTESVMPFQDDRGLPFNYVCGKTLRDGTKHVFGVLRSEDAVIHVPSHRYRRVCPWSGKAWSQTGGTRPLPFPAVQRRRGVCGAAVVRTVE
jgi:hypothetical protein